MPILVKNKRATFDYNILEKLEAGIVLNGPEVKSIRLGQANLKGSYVVIKNRENSPKPEAWLLNCHISPYKFAGENFKKSYNPKRSRKLLLHRKEIDYLVGKQKEKGLTLIPLSLYTSGRKIKVKIGIGKGKKKFEKREDIKKKEDLRRIKRALKERF